MTRDEHLFNQLSEECAEVAHRVSKLLRFGPGEVQKGQKLSNRARLQGELQDLIATAEMLNREGLIGNYKPAPAYVRHREQRFERYLRHSDRCGTVTEPKQ